MSKQPQTKRILYRIDQTPREKLVGEQFSAVLATPDFSNLEIENSWTYIDPSQFQGMLLSVNIYDNKTKEMYIRGSAALTDPRYCLCATHVIEEFVAGFESEELTILFTGYYIGKVVMWQAKSLVAYKGYDITMVSIEPCFKPQDVGVIRCTELAFEMPTLGSSVVIAGTIAQLPTYSMEDNANNPPTVESRLCRGTVIDIYPEGRDTSQIPMPAFTIQTPAWGGMSGGPAFNENGQLIGLISTSFDNAPTTVSLIVSPDSPAPRDMMKRHD